MKSPPHWKQRSPDSSLREYCNWPEITTGIEATDYISILSNYGCGNRLQFTAKRQKNYGEIMEEFLSSHDAVVI